MADISEPSALALVPFVSVAKMMALIHHRGLATVLAELTDAIEAEFHRWPEFDKTPRVAAHSANGVIELMPAADHESYGFKYVNGHPLNTRLGYQTVTAFGVLSRVDNGYPALDRDDAADGTAHGGDLCDGRAETCAARCEDHGDDRQWGAMRVPGRGVPCGSGDPATAAI